MLIAILIVLAHSLAIQASVLSRTHLGDDIEALCARKSVDLTTFVQLKSLGQAADKSSCSSTLKDAISELVQLIEKGKDDLCSVSSIDELRAYYAKYLDTSRPVDEDKELLPSSLTRFVLAYGMQTSNLCKKNMIHVLNKEGRELVAPSDFKQLELLIRDNGAVAQVLGTIISPGEVFLPGDLAPFFKRHNLKSNDLGADDKLIMQTTTADYIKKVQLVCQHRFKPVYEPLMMPLVRLLNMGFDYKDEPLKCDLECPRVVHDVVEWSRIVFVCAALENVRLVEQKEDQVQGEEGSASQLVRILTKEEADTIEGAQPFPDIEDSVYMPHIKVALPDQIYNKSDKQLNKAIKSFKTNHDEEYVLRKRILKKGLELLKKELKSGHFGFIFSAAWKSRLHKRQGVDSPSKKLVETLNDMLEQQQSSGSLDGPMRMSDEDFYAHVGASIMTAILIAIFICIYLFGFGVIG